MQTIKAIYDGVGFKPMQPIPAIVKENYEVFITFVEPVRKDVKEHPRSKFIGSWKGKIWMSDDFNEPLEEMKEYM